MATIKKQKKVSELPEATDTTGFWIFGSKTISGVVTSVKFAFDKITPLFGVSQTIGSSITAAPSENAVKKVINKIYIDNEFLQDSLLNMGINGTTGAFVTPTAGKYHRSTALQLVNARKYIFVEGWKGGATNLHVVGFYDVNKNPIGAIRTDVTKVIPANAVYYSVFITRFESVSSDPIIDYSDVKIYLTDTDTQGLHKVNDSALPSSIMKITLFSSLSQKINGCIRKDYSIDTSAGSYVRSVQIQIPEEGKGTEYNYSLTGSVNVSLIAGYDSSNRPVFQIVGDGTLKTGKFIMPQNVASVICSNHVNNTEPIFKGIAIASLKEAINELSKNDVALPELTTKHKLFSSLSQKINGCIKKDYSIDTAAGSYIRSTQIQIPEEGKGTEYNYSLIGSANVSLIAGYDSSNQPVFQIVGDGTLKTDKFIMPQNVTSVICSNHVNNTEPEFYGLGVSSLVDTVLSATEQIDELRGQINIKSKETGRVFVQRKPIFCFMYDDLRTSDPLVWSIHQEFNLPASFGLVTNNITANNIKFYQEAYRDGCSILSHSLSHVLPQNEAEIVNSKKILEGYGFTVNGWLNPGGGLNPASLLGLVKRQYAYAYTRLNFTDPAVALDNTFKEAFSKTQHPATLTRFSMEAFNANDINQSKIKAVIDFAVENKLFCTMYAHQLPSTYQNTNGTSVFSETDLRAVLSYVSALEQQGYCEVLSADEAVARYYKDVLFD